MSAEDLEKYETEMELSLYREYRDIVGQFNYVVNGGSISRTLSNSFRTMRTAKSTSSCVCPTRGCGICTVRPVL